MIPTSTFLPASGLPLGVRPLPVTVSAARSTLALTFWICIVAGPPVKLAVIVSPTTRRFASPASHQETEKLPLKSVVVGRDPLAPPLTVTVIAISGGNPLPLIQFWLAIAAREGTAL